MWEKKCASRRVEVSSKRKFIKKGKDSSNTSALRQERSLESASKWLKTIKLRNTMRAKGPKSSFNQEMKDQKKKKRKEKKAR